ncbi:MAG: TetM/TetW/TetO/TetS family tetracycline resistance ribosomal protection protein [Lachnospiraceae bacterium]|nr:TetM/TetW/TetO/TetS family tetracycline resistance ribosomal protection protein [Candidatus Merdinaster equi]
MTEQKNSRITIGIVAHVDAGKTTLSESLLFGSGVISSSGRVDSGNTFLDTDVVEKERGITIYTKNARIPISGDRQAGEFILIDTPGHVDFGPEMERALSVMDYAILLISAPEGIQSHTRTLWSLLKSYRIPTLIYVNKTDIKGVDCDSLMSQIKNKLSDCAISFKGLQETHEIGFELTSEMCEEIAATDEVLISEFLESNELSMSSVQSAFSNRSFFPVLFGSALTHEGTASLLSVINRLFMTSEAGATDNQCEPGGIIYKITYDKQGKRLAFLRVTSGTLRVRSVLGDEKITEIRIYSGEKYSQVGEVSAGEICAIPGLTSYQAGDTFGKSQTIKSRLLTPAISYAVHFPIELNQNVNTDTREMLRVMEQLTEEDPSLATEYNEQMREIQVRLMGDIQTQILKRTLLDRFGLNAEFGEGKICYKETVDASTIGVGHFEPLRHYAEVQLRIEPLPLGSGLEFASEVSEDLLDKNWQRLIMTHLQEREHRGVLTGAPITDIRFTIVAGRAHNKHTEGGDFRQATYRAIRQGLMKLFATDNCRLLEPYYDYTLRLPESNVGRAMTDISAMPGTCNISENDYDNGITVLTGTAPVSAMNHYTSDVIAYTKGLGQLSFSVSGYGPCHNEAEVLSSTRYNPDADLRNPSSSVFCSHGAGTVIPWNEVDLYKHLDYSDGYFTDRSLQDSEEESAAANKQRRLFENMNNAISTEEIDSILQKSSHANAEGRKGSYKGISESLRRTRLEKSKSDSSSEAKYKGSPRKEPYLLVDGYNVIHAWAELSSLMEASIDAAAGRLNDILSSYQAITGVHLIVVYDAYKVKGHSTEEMSYHNITVVYTREAQTADQYIERFAHENASKYEITVVTSDGLEQIIIRGAGALLISSREFEDIVNQRRTDFNATHNITSDEE